jgi:hypothetical protein
MDTLVWFPSASCPAPRTIQALGFGYEVVTGEYAAPPLALKLHDSRETLYA